jgi:hypothetical protein
VAVCGNMGCSHKMKSSVTWKTQCPCCFESNRFLPHPYELNREAWMIFKLFIQWLI